MARAARRFIGLDVHQATTSICVRDRAGRIVEQCVIPTTAPALRRYFPPRRSVAVAFEEGPLAAWLFRLLTGRVGQLVVCNPRYNRLIRAGVKNDRIDAAKLSELLRLGALHPVHHDRTPLLLREFVAHYSTIVNDTMRVMLRLKAVYRGRGIVAEGVTVYGCRHRKRWLRRVKCDAVRCRLVALYRQLDALTALRDDARVEMITEATRHPEFALLRSIPCVGDIRAAQLLAYLGGTRRFNARQHLWSYAGLAVVSRSSSDHRVEDNRIVPRAKPNRGLTRNYHPQLKRVLKDIALAGSLARGPIKKLFEKHVSRGLTPSVARIVIARRIASTVRAIIRDRVEFDPDRF